MLSIAFIKHFVSLHANWAYLLIVLGVIIEGEIIVIFAGIFAYLGSLNIFIAGLATIVGGGIKSVIGYSIGYYLNKYHSHRKFLYNAERRINYFLPRFNSKPFWSIFLSRFLILGIYWFALIFAGYKKIKIKTFIKAEISSLLSWTVVMLSIGYFFGYTAISISKDIRKFFGIILVFFIAFFILEKIVAFIVELFNTDNSYQLDESEDSQ